MATLNKGMLAEEDLRDYVCRMTRIYRLLLGNGFQLLIEEFNQIVVKGLPAEMQPQALYSTLGATSSEEQLLAILRLHAKGYGFDDSKARVQVPQANMGVPGPLPSGKQDTSVHAKSSSSGTGRGRYKDHSNTVCFICNERGHIARDCPERGKKFKAANLQADFQKVMASMAALQMQGPWNVPPQTYSPGSHSGGSWGPVASYGAPVGQYPALGSATPSDTQCPPPFTGPPMWHRGPPGPPGNPVAFTINVIEPVGGGTKSVRWLLDTGASVHLIKDLSLLFNPVPLAQPIPLQVAVKGPKSQVVATGSLCLVNEHGQSQWLHNVHCVPTLVNNLLSVGALTKNGIQPALDEHGDMCRITAPNGWTTKVTHVGNLYMLNSVQPCVGSVTACPGIPEVQHNCDKAQLWHQRLGHPGITNMIRLTNEDLVKGVDVKLSMCNNCEKCQACVCV